MAALKPAELLAQARAQGLDRDLPAIAVEATLLPGYTADDDRTLLEPSMLIAPIAHPILAAALTASGAIRRGRMSWLVGMGREEFNSRPFRALLQNVQPGTVYLERTACTSKKPNVLQTVTNKAHAIAQHFAGTPAAAVLPWQQVRDRFDPTHPLTGAGAYGAVTVSGDERVTWIKVVTHQLEVPEHLPQIALNLRPAGRAYTDPKPVRPVEAMAVLEWLTSVGVHVEDPSENGDVAVIRRRLTSSVVAYPTPGRPALAQASIGRKVYRQVRAALGSELDCKAPETGVATVSTRMTAEAVMDLAQQLPEVTFAVHPGTADAGRLALAGPVDDDDRLRGYQREAIGIHDATTVGYGQFCAPGMGKTIMAFGGMQRRARRTPAYRGLAVTEANVRQQWVDEAPDWFPEATMVKVESRSDAPKLARAMATSDGPVVAVVSYGLLAAVSTEMARRDALRVAEEEAARAATPVPWAFTGLLTDRPTGAGSLSLLDPDADASRDREDMLPGTHVPAPAPTAEELARFGTPEQDEHSDTEQAAAQAVEQAVEPGPNTAQCSIGAPDTVREAVQDIVAVPLSKAAATSGQLDLFAVLLEEVTSNPDLVEVVTATRQALRTSEASTTGADSANGADGTTGTVDVAVNDAVDETVEAGDEYADADLGALLLDTYWHDIIADEAEVLRGTGSRQAVALWALRRNSGVALVLTGTPINRGVDDLGRLLSWVRNDEHLFRGVRLSEVFDLDTEDGLAEFTAAMGPMMFRRDASEISDELPTLCPVVQTLTPSPEEKALASAARDELKRVYEELLAALEVAESLDPDNPEYETARAALVEARGAWLGGTTLARMASSDPAALLGSTSAGAALLAGQGLIEAATGVTGTKRSWVVNDVVTRVGEGHKVLIFTEFATVARGIIDDLDAAGVRVGEVLGGGGKKRDRMVAAFQAGDLDVLVCTAAGERGLNLQQATTIVHYDLPWTPKGVVQRTGRAMRIKSKNKRLDVVFPLMEGTIEERVAGLVVARAVESMQALDASRGIDVTRTEMGMALGGLVAKVAETNGRAGQSAMMAVTEALVA